MILSVFITVIPDHDKPQPSGCLLEVEGAYRLMRNPSVSPEAIAEAGFTAIARACEAYPLLLALENTTINFSHSTAFDDLGNTTTNPKTHGLLVLSVLMYVPDSALPVGLIEQPCYG